MSANRGLTIFFARSEQYEIISSDGGKRIIIAPISVAMEETVILSSSDILSVAGP